MADNSQVTDFSVAGVKHAIIKKAFDGNADIFRNVMVTTASPNGTVTSGVIGTLAWDETNGDAYINTDTSTTWVKINA
jgi:hypothetical protein